MAYFSNGTEGMIYESQYCEKCVNYRVRGNDAPVQSCPIMDVHFDHSYGQGGKTAKGKVIKDILETLIPMKGVYADECSMYLERTAVERDSQGEYLDKLREGTATLRDNPIFSD